MLPMFTASEMTAAINFALTLPEPTTVQETKWYGWRAMDGIIAIDERLKQSDVSEVEADALFDLRTALYKQYDRARYMMQARGLVYT